MSRHLCIALAQLVLLCNVAPPACATFSTTFQNFLKSTYGSKTEADLSRTDLGADGSFGGGTSPNVKKRPIIFVHGIAENAGKIIKLRDFFWNNGYADNELYGTTYGPTSVIDASGAVHCQYARIVRSLIEAVLAYTGADSVNVIGYSMGVIVSRKAILGGTCVEINENIGTPLTKSVHTYIGIAGPNHGSISCLLGTLFGIASCNAVNGMVCYSKFLNDINKQKHYEGKNVFVIQTIPDLLVGNFVCDLYFTTYIKGSNRTITKIGVTHDDIYYKSAPDQYELIKKYDEM